MREIAGGIGCHSNQGDSRFDKVMSAGSEQTAAANARQFGTDKSGVNVLYYNALFGVFYIETLGKLIHVGLKRNTFIYF